MKIKNCIIIFIMLLTIFTSGCNDEKNYTSVNSATNKNLVSERSNITSSYTQEHIKSEKTSLESNLYISNTFGFSINFPNSWKGKFIIKENEKGIDVYYKALCKKNEMIFSIFNYGSQEKWNKDLKDIEENDVCTKLALINGNVFVTMEASENLYDINNPKEIEDSQIFDEMLKDSFDILNSFEIIKKNDNSLDEEYSEFDRIIDSLNICLKDIYDDNLSKNERIRQSKIFVEKLELLLSMENSLQLSDKEFEELLNNKIISNTKIINQNGSYNKVRIVGYNGLPELFGSLERVWTFLQWESKGKVNTKLVFDQNAEKVDDFFLKYVNNRHIILLGGHLTTNERKHIFLSAWEFKDNNLKELDIFNDNITLNNSCYYRIYNNELDMEYNNEDYMIIKLNKENDGFIVYSDNNSNIKFEFKLLGDEIKIID